MKAPTRFCLTIPAAAALLLAGCLDAQSAPVLDQPIPAYQTELLDLAFDAASALPLNPHVKNRSLAQESVVAASLKLGQPQRALAYNEQIKNWRRGAGYADYAFYLAQQGGADQVPHYLALARAVADNPDETDGQDWRGDRIRVKIARTLLWLGQTDEAAAVAAGASASEAGELADVRIQQADSAVFEAALEAADAAVLTLNFDLVRNALMDCAHLFGRFYAEPELRDRAEAKIKSSWGSLPLMVRLELMMTLAEQALQRTDPVKTLALTEESLTMLQSAVWLPEDEIRLRAQLAALRHRAGDAATARAEADAALGLYEVQRVRIVDIDRAEALRHLAECYQVMGDRAAALAVYRRAAEEAVVNPNSRPRAMDLTALCVSLATNGVEPDAALWEQLRAVQTGLADPW